MVRGDILRISKLAGIVGATVLFALFCANHSEANLITWNSGTNQWTISNFQLTGVGNYSNAGAGLAGSGPHVRNGFALEVGWQPAGGWHFYNNQSEYTDYWHPDTLSWTVTGATWSNTPTNTDGSYYLYTLSGATLGTAIADGTLLNGTFTWESNTGAGGTGVLIYTAAVPEPSSVALIFATGGLGMVFSRSRRRRRHA